MPVPPERLPLSLAGGGALAINLLCAFMLARYRNHAGSLTRAAFLSARNNALANIAIISVGLLTPFLWRSIWPDLIVGLGIALPLLNADAAREVWTAARTEHKAATPQQLNCHNQADRVTTRCLAAAGVLQVTKDHERHRVTPRTSD